MVVKMTLHTGKTGINSSRFTGMVPVPALKPDLHPRIKMFGQARIIITRFAVAESRGIHQQHGGVMGVSQVIDACKYP